MSAAESDAMASLSLENPGSNPSESWVESYRQQLARAPYNAELWMEFLHAAKAQSDGELTREVYADILQRYPHSGRLLSEYVELELSLGEKERAESVFNEKLFTAPSLELWKCYLNYVLRSNTDASGMVALPENRTTVLNCYKLVLENGKYGFSYIEFLSTGEGYGQYEEQLKATQMREAFQQAVAIPLLKVEEIWKRYDAFENGQNRAAAKRYLSELSPTYMTARTAMREMSKFFDEMQHTAPVHSLPKQPEWTQPEITYLEAWKRYLKWEISNPLRLTESAGVQKRVIYAYNQACMALRFFPEVWIEFASYLWALGQRDAALAKIRDASEVMPESLAVQFSYAEMAEKMKQFSLCKDIYEGLVTSARSALENVSAKYTRRLDKLSQKLNKMKEAANAGDHAMDSPSAAPANDGEDSAVSSESECEQSASEGDDFMGDSEGKAKRLLEKRISRTRVRMEEKMSEKRTTYTLIWTMYMRYVRRCCGGRATTPAGYITYHLFVSAALIEYHVGKRPDVAGRLFEYYSKNYSDDTEYILQYITHLINSNDDKNARAVFERFHAQAAGESKQLWDMFADYEYNYGDISSIEKLDSPDESVISRAAAKFGCLDIDCVAERDFGFAQRTDSISRNNDDDDDDFAGGMGYSAAMPGLAVGTVYGKQMNKKQLLAPVQSSRFVKPSVGGLQPYNPTIEPLPEFGTDAMAGTASGTPTGGMGADMSTWPQCCRHPTRRRSSSSRWMWRACSTWLWTRRCRVRWCRQITGRWSICRRLCVQHQQQQPYGRRDNSGHRDSRSRSIPEPAYRGYSAGQSRGSRGGYGGRSTGSSYRSTPYDRNTRYGGDDRGRSGFRGPPNERPYGQRYDSNRSYSRD
ncbi:Suf-domain-containing protein [Linderina pennispora]|uniref:Suf-domain-containing protein n=1 Tax=Linderina pennispora TaxID=61395 RepID=A0A1Y1WJK6_9FUNG|nr:Suf-domain-containing protein [Linderina pennispora]ORX73662.1 Suf-domain-containing protein [Linderina pennispora]